MKKLLPLLSVALLAACSPGNDAAEPKAASPAAAASAPVVQAASAPAAASAEVQSAEAQAASAAEDNWTPPAAASEPKAQAEQLNDLLGQFKDEAAQRTEAYRQKNMQPSYEESIALVREEVAAVRLAAQHLNKLQLSDSEVAAARDAQAKLMILLAESSEEQLKSVMSSAPESEADLPDPAKLDAIEQTQQEAEQSLKRLLRKYRIRAK